MAWPDGPPLGAFMPPLMAAHRSVSLQDESAYCNSPAFLRHLNPYHTTSSHASNAPPNICAGGLRTSQISPAVSLCQGHGIRVRMGHDT